MRIEIIRTLVDHIGQSRHGPLQLNSGIIQCIFTLAGKLVLGFIGSFYAYEGLDLLLEAFPHISKALPDARLLIVGGGLEEENLKRQARELSMEDRVVFTGRVPHDQVEQYYSLIDLFYFIFLC